jgi:hypothetical protein
MNTITVLRCALLGASLVLAGCSGDDLSRTFGMTRDAPDEFTVTTRAPLSMPPDFSLRPPQPGAPRPQEQSTTQSAQVTVAGSAGLTGPATTGSDSPGQDALLAAAGQPAPAGIRSLVDADAEKLASDHALSGRLLFWKPATPPGTAVDAQKEAERLRENAALGKGPDQGDTPVIQNKPKNFLDWLF